MCVNSLSEKRVIDTSATGVSESIRVSVLQKMSTYTVSNIQYIFDNTNFTLINQCFIRNQPISKHNLEHVPQ